MKRERNITLSPAKNNTMKNTTHYYIYLVTCTVNDRHYCGQTTNPEHRFFACHQNNKKMQEDIKLHGAKAFKVEWLARVDDENRASELEDFYSNKYECFTKGYNTAHRFRSAHGLKRTEKSNAKRSKSMGRLVWVYNHKDMSTRRVSAKEAVELCTSNQGWHLGRFSSRTRDKNKQLINLPELPEGTGEWFKAS